MVLACEYRLGSRLDEVLRHTKAACHDKRGLRGVCTLYEDL